MTCSIEKLVLITKFDPLFMQTILAEELRIAIFDDVRSRVMASMHTITHAQFTANGIKGDNSVVDPDSRKGARGDNQRLGVVPL